MKVAAYRAPLLSAGSLEAVELIQERVAWCESEGVSILCCPEAVLGGLADYSENPALLAIRTDNGQLASVLTPLASDRVICIVGFTQPGCDGTFGCVPPWPSKRRLSKSSSGHTALGVCSGLGDSYISRGPVDVRHRHLQRLKLS
jgi:hypothetical protein